VTLQNIHKISDLDIGLR